MKHLLIIFGLLAMLNRVVKPEPWDDGGVTTLTTVPYDSPTACLITLSYELQPTQIKFSATIIKNDFYDCTRHNLQYVSTFRGDQVNDNITLSPTANPYVWSGYMPLSDVTRMNGTSCLYAGYDIVGKKYYGCLFKFGNINFLFDLGLDPVTGQFATDWINQINPLLGVNKKDSQQVNGASVDVWRPNTTYPQLVGMLYNQCGSWSSVISGAGTHFTVTGTELQSNTVNLQTLLGSYFLNAIWIRQRNAPTSNYIIYNIPANTTVVPFNTAPVNNCSDTGITYGDLLKQDLNYCKNGCDLAMFLLDGMQVFNFPTAGFTTQ